MNEELSEVYSVNSSAEAAATAAQEAAAFQDLLREEYALFNPHLVHKEGIDEIYAYVLPSLATFGVLANFLAFIVWRSRNRNKGASPLSLLLQWLGAYDIGVAVLSVAMYGLPALINGKVCTCLHKQETCQKKIVLFRCLISIGATIICIDITHICLPIILLYYTRLLLAATT